MNKQFNNVSLVYTHTLRTMSQYGAYQYSFIVDKDEFLSACRKAIEANKRLSWSSSDTTDAKLLKMSHVKTKRDIENEDIIAHMGDNDVLVSVKGIKGLGKDKQPCAIRTTNPDKYPGWFSVANVIVDLYVWEWSGKKGISCQANGDLITIQVTKYTESTSDNAVKGFELETSQHSEDTENSGFSVDDNDDETIY